LNYSFCYAQNRCAETCTLHPFLIGTTCPTSQPCGGAAVKFILQREDEVIGKYQGIVALNIRLSVSEEENELRKP